MDYTNSCIYHIRNKITKNIIYVGSTRDLNHRTILHKSTCNNINSEKYNLQVYKFIRETSFDSYEFIPVKYLSLNNNLELRTEEQNEINKHSNLLNDQNAVKNIERAKEYQKGYNIINRDRIKEYNKEYREKNKEKIKEYKKEKITCECGCVFSRSSKSDHLKSKKHLDNIEKV